MREKVKIKFEFAGETYLATVHPRPAKNQSLEYLVIYAKTSPPTSGGQLLVASHIDGGGDPIWVECHTGTRESAKDTAFVQAAGYAIEESFE